MKLPLFPALLLSLPLCVRAVSFDDWRLLHFTAVELANPAIAGAASDPDGDGRSNWLEYTTDSDPKLADAFTAPWTSLDTAGRLTLTFPRWKQFAGYLYIPQVSSDLSRWKSGPLHIASVGLTFRDTQSDFVTVRDQLSTVTGGKRFIRLMIGIDTDGDGLPDYWELLHGLSPYDPTDAYADFNNNGVTNAEEFENGTDPLAPPPPPPGLTPPVAPGGLRIITDPNGGRHVYWISHSDNETYFVLRDYLPDGTVVELARVGPGKTEIYLPPPQ